MPTPTIVRSKEAQSDFRRLYAWIAKDGGKARARKVLRRLDHGIVRLAKHPLLGRARPDLKGEPRSFPIASWLIVYEPLKTEPGIHLLRVLDNRRDIAALLGKKS